MTVIGKNGFSADMSVNGKGINNKAGFVRGHLKEAYFFLKMIHRIRFKIHRHNGGKYYFLTAFSRASVVVI
jgi:hypothetical protein